MQPKLLAPVIVVLTACTTLGPMPATTGVSAIPAERPGGEVQAAVMPVFFLSDAARDAKRSDKLTPQLSGLFEPDRLFGTKGLIVGARAWGESGDSPVEPMIGFRHKLDEGRSVAGVGFGTYVRGANSGASYTATRLGGELVVDGTLVPMGPWLGLHGQVSGSATYLDARGEYCVNAGGDGTDCDDGTRRVDGAIAGIYMSATAGLSLDIARRPHGVLHGVRLAFLVAAGVMPRIRDGIQEPSNDAYRSFGLSITVGLGSER